MSAINRAKSLQVDVLQCVRPAPPRRDHACAACRRHLVVPRSAAYRGTCGSRLEKAQPALWALKATSKPFKGRRELRNLGLPRNCAKSSLLSQKDTRENRGHHGLRLPKGAASISSCGGLEEDANVQTARDTGCVGACGDDESDEAGCCLHDVCQRLTGVKDVCVVLDVARTRVLTRYLRRGRLCLDDAVRAVSTRLARLPRSVQRQAAICNSVGV